MYSAEYLFISVNHIKYRTSPRKAKNRQFPNRLTCILVKHQPPRRGIKCTPIKCPHKSGILIRSKQSRSTICPSKLIANCIPHITNASNLSDPHGHSGSLCNNDVKRSNASKRPQWRWISSSYQEEYLAEVRSWFARTVSSRLLDAMLGLWQDTIRVRNGRNA